uniref:Uncharacterized protein n=1 Tax=Favella ehrenbergii TaxID=182087 RepID=A0A7S3MPC8_9SPIT|mmetsp:Transcript_33772/g.41730  ORF Transcript_33772/g.41730 Transcript_33772/m.41730 type:complete len:234 (+) Transcript_33772:38-739(+)|eukprot:CAMPEP_0170460818 /NCGR_PEP_ID=MMETSP0123-20130129/7001_1 /TAXON_ID=182087 /ORGANISM="Favella ehrenbergii, Strain Fehren 1" /LENGTH=233 /DNA_ID=CAMNT_0010725773 /DNA_START=20 /DNA_END=721 /DNA_ORIENTATION=+
MRLAFTAAVLAAVLAGSTEARRGRRGRGGGRFFPRFTYTLAHCYDETTADTNADVIGGILFSQSSREGAPVKYKTKWFGLTSGTVYSLALEADPTTKLGRDFTARDSTYGGLWRDSTTTVDLTTNIGQNICLYDAAGTSVDCCTLTAGRAPQSLHRFIRDNKPVESSTPGGLGGRRLCKSRLFGKSRRACESRRGDGERAGRRGRRGRGEDRSEERVQEGGSFGGKLSEADQN